MLVIPTGISFVEVRLDAISHPVHYPVLLKADANAVQPYRLMCPVCGEFVTAGTPDDAVRLWNQRYQPPAANTPAVANDFPERTVSLWSVDGSVLNAVVNVPVMSEGEQDLIVWENRFFKQINGCDYWECVNVTVL